MPAGQESGDDLKTTIGQARKKPLAFGLCLGKKADTTLLMTHKTKSPSVVGQQARKAGETSKFTFGMMSVKGKNMMLTCEGDVPAGMARKTKEYLKSAGFPMKVVLLDMSGATIESDGDDDEEENEAGLALTAEEPEEETVASLPEAVIMPCSSWSTLTLLPTSMNILEPPMRQAFSLTGKVSSSASEPSARRSKTI